MDINVHVDIPAIDRLADVLAGNVFGRLEKSVAAAIEPSAPEPQTAPAPAAPTMPASAAPVNPTPAPVATQTAPVSTVIAPVTHETSAQANPAPVPPVPTTPATAPTYTRDQLAKAATDTFMSNRMADLTNLLASFGVASLMDLPEVRFGEFATALRGMGAVI